MKLVPLLLLLMLWLPLTAIASINVTDFGTAGDGDTDDTAAFQEALDAAAEAGGGIVDVPTGHYAIRGNLSIPGGVTLRGTHLFAPTDQREEREQLDGSVLLAYAGRGEGWSDDGMQKTGTPLITLAGSMAGLSGFMVKYPEVDITEVPPAPYPPTVFAGAAANVLVENCNFLNSYEAIHFNGTGRYMVRNVHGFPIKRGFFIDFCLDVGRLENVHFWPFGGWWGVDHPLGRWIGLNGIAFEFRRSDWQFTTNTFCFGYGVGYKFAKSARPDADHGTTNGNFLGIAADACETAVLIEETSIPGLQIVNGEFVGRWGSDTAVTMKIVADSPNAHVNLSNSAFWGPIDVCIQSPGDNAVLLVDNCTFRDWDNAARGSAAVEVGGGKLVLRGSNFVPGGLAVRVGENVKHATLMGNIAAGGFEAVTEAPKRTQMLANEPIMATLTPEQARHYRIDVGSEGDQRYLQAWHHREPAVGWGGEGTQRWSGTDSMLRLPVAPGVSYNVVLETSRPAEVDTPPVQVKLNGKTLATVEGRGHQRVELSVPPQEGDAVTLRLAGKGWRPVDLMKDTQDPRTLGMLVRTIEVRAEGADKQPVTDANRGGVAGSL